MTSLGTWRMVLWTGIAAALAFFVRSWLDFRFVFAEFVPDTDVVTTGLTMVFYAGAGFAWLWAIAAVAQERRKGAVALAVLSGLLLVGLWVGTFFAWCPFPCETAAPLSEISSIGGLAIGLVAMASAVTRIRAGE